MPRLRQQGVDVRPFFYPLSAIPAFRDTPEAAKAQKTNKVAYCVSPYAINLPSALSLDEAAIGKVNVILRKEVGALRQS